MAAWQHADGPVSRDKPGGQTAAAARLDDAYTAWDTALR